MEKRVLVHIGRAGDLAAKKDRIIFRALEIFPGALAWTTLIGVVVLSWGKPSWAAFFIIIFDVYWLSRSLYLVVHLLVSYRRLRRSLRTNWRVKLDSLDSAAYSIRPLSHWSDVWHVILLPMYREEAEVVAQALDTLVHAEYPKERMIVVLATEERAGAQARVVAESMQKRFGNAFHAFLVTRHPDHLPGEIAGKGSNEAWAAQEVKTKIIDPQKIPYEAILVSSFDADTRVLPQYFLCLTHAFLTAENPLQASYQPIPLYNNNIWDAPAFSRIVATSNTVWQMMQQARPAQMETFSSHAMSFKTLVDIGFWNRKIVSEDSFIFYQCLLWFDGNYRVVPLFYPVSMDAPLAKNLFRTALNTYRQQRRWGYGVEKIPFTLFGFLKNARIPLSKKLFYSWVMIEGFWSWACAALLILALGWLPVVLGGAEFSQTLLSYHLPRVTRTLMTIATIGLLTTGIVATVLLPPRPKYVGIWTRLSIILQWALLPVTLILFGAFPGLEAQTRMMLGKYMGFWVTEKVRKRVEADPR